MVRCDHCGEEIFAETSFSCSYCELSLCPDHRLPEAHSCIALRSTDASDLEFSSDIVLGERESGGQSKKQTAKDAGNCDHERDAPEQEGIDDADDPAEKTYSCLVCGKRIPPNQGHCDDCREEIINKRNRATDRSSPYRQDTVDSDAATRKHSRIQVGERDSRTLINWPSFQRLAPSFSRRTILVSLLGAIGGGSFVKRETIQRNTESVVTGASEVLDGPEFDRAKCAQLIHEKVNDERQQNGIAPLSYDDQLESDALQHSRDMAEHEFFGHSDPEGRSLSERVSVPCQVYAENVAKTPFAADVKRPTGTTEFVDTADEVAEITVNGWMLSTGHRQNVLDERFTSEGFGVYKTESDDVLVTQLFCG